MTDDDYTRLRATLESGGYQEIPEVRGVKAGDRVRHYGEQYSEAHTNGTATVLAVMQSGRTISGRPDIELIVRRDRPFLPSMSPVTNWADYHTCAIRKTAEWMPAPPTCDHGQAGRHLDVKEFSGSGDWCPGPTGTPSEAGCGECTEEGLGNCQHGCRERALKADTQQQSH